MKNISIIFPNQLFKESPLLKLNCEIIILEDSLFFGNDRIHTFKNNINKLIFIRASIRSYIKYLTKKGHNVIYAKNEKLFTTTDYFSKYLGDKYQCINMIDPHDYLIMRRVNNFALENKIKINIFKSPMFVTKDNLVNEFLKNKSKPLMARFYQNQRKSHNILLNSDGTPYGGKWSFDEFNRKKIPKNKIPPEIFKLPKNNIVNESEKSIIADNIDSIGCSDFFFYPTSFEEAEKWFEDFLENRFSFFGDYEDAISKDEFFLWHSLLSPLLNNGLLTPSYVLDKALAYGSSNNIPLNSLEGFIRQLIGWREFICLVYKKYGTEMRLRNFWNFKNTSIPKAFYEAKTGIAPVDNVITNTLKFGYCHHIERLMILGNFMLLCRIHPDQVYKWFMEMFVDSYDWVMVPNIYGMSQFSDGGIFSTKPYISSSNYIRKMSNYKKGNWCEIWDSLFWMFIKDNEPFFRKQYRLAMLTRNLDKMGDEKLNNHMKIANSFLKELFK